MQEEGIQGFGTDIAPDTSTTGFGVELWISAAESGQQRRGSPGVGEGRKERAGVLSVGVQGR